MAGLSSIQLSLFLPITIIKVILVFIFVVSTGIHEQKIASVMGNAFSFIPMTLGAGIGTSWLLITIVSSHRRTVIIVKLKRRNCAVRVKVTSRS
jgi:hypothetical protein